MNSAKQFSTNFTSVWSLLTPTMDYYVRKINMTLFEQDYPPMIGNIAANRRGFINEIAFRRFQIRTQGKASDDKVTQQVISEAADFIDSVDRSGTKVERVLSEAENKDAEIQATRLELYCTRIAYRQGNDLVPKPIKCKPFIRGCGFVDNGYGDVLIGSMLIEVKSGERPFRSIDLRQVVTYLCLLKIDNHAPIRQIGLLNPRKGVSFEIDVDTLSAEICGRPSGDLLHDLSQVMSAGGISR